MLVKFGKKIKIYLATYSDKITGDMDPEELVKSDLLKDDIRVRILGNNVENYVFANSEGYPVINHRLLYMGGFFCSKQDVKKDVPHTSIAQRTVKEIQNSEVVLIDWVYGSIKTNITVLNIASNCGRQIINFVDEDYMVEKSNKPYWFPLATFHMMNLSNIYYHNISSKDDIVEFIKNGEFIEGTEPNPFTVDENAIIDFLDSAMTMFGKLPMAIPQDGILFSHAVANARKIIEARALAREYPKLLGYDPNIKVTYQDLANRFAIQDIIRNQSEE